MTSSLQNSRREWIRAGVWALAGITWGWIVWAGKQLPDESRYRLPPMLRGLPKVFSDSTFLVHLAAVALIGSVAFLLRRKREKPAIPLSPVVPVLLLFPLLLSVQAILGPGNLRNLLRVYSVTMAGTLCLALAVAPALAQLRPRFRLSLASVLLLVALYSVLWGRWTLHRHAVFGSAAWDLGYIESALWNTTRGRLFQTTVVSASCRNIFGDHFIPIQILVLPFYIIGGRTPQALLVIQSVWLATGAIPLFLLARRRWNDPIASVFLSGTYLLYPALHIVNVFDFHSVALSIPFLFWAFYYLDREVWFNFGLFLFLACLCKEEIPLIGVFWGVYILVARRRWVPGLLTSVACAILFWLAVRVWLPAFSDRQEFWPLVRYQELGSTFGEAFRTVVTRPVYVLGVALQPAKLEFMLRLLAPLLFLPLFSPGSWIFAAPALAICVLSSVPDMYSMADHHVTSPLTALLLATVLGIDTLSRRLKNRVSPTTFIRVGALASLCCTGWIAGMQWQSSVYDRLEPLKQPFDDHIASGHRLVQRIPDEVTVEAPNHLVPHLTHRDQIWVFPEAAGKAEWIMLDLSDHDGRGRKTYPLLPKEFENRVRDILARGGYGKVAFENGFLLLSRNANDNNFGEVLRVLEGVTE